MANPKNKSSAPAAAVAAAPAAPAAKQSGFERGKDYTPALECVEIDLDTINFRKRGVQTESKYSGLLETVGKLGLGRGHIVSELEAEGVTGKVLFQRLSPYIRRHSMTANPNGMLTVRLDDQGRVIVGCVDKSNFKPARPRRAKVEAAPASAPTS